MEVEKSRTFVCNTAVPRDPWGDSPTRPHNAWSNFERKTSDYRFTTCIYRRVQVYHRASFPRLSNFRTAEVLASAFEFVTPRPNFVYRRPKKRSVQFAQSEARVRPVSTLSDAIVPFELGVNVSDLARYLRTQKRELASIMMPDLRMLNYTIQGTSSSSTWRARRHSLLGVLTSSSIFSFACHEPFIAEVPSLNSNELKLVDFSIGDFSDSSALLNLLITHCNHYTVFCGPALFLSQILHHFAFIDDVFEITASYTLLSIILQLDAANCTGISTTILTALAANSLTSSAFLSQSQLFNTFCIIIWFGSRIHFRRQRTRVVTTPNYDSSTPCNLVFMGLIQVIATEPLNTRSGQSAFLTVITDAICITESVHPDSVLAITLNLHALLVIHQINSDVLYHARFRAGSIFDKVLFDTLAPNVTVLVSSDIQVPDFVVFAADVAMRDTIVAEALAINMWVTPNAGELWESLERCLDVHHRHLIAVRGLKKLYIRSTEAHIFNVDKDLKINQFENENMQLHQDMFLYTTLADIPHFVMAWSPESLDCFAQIAVQYLWNHTNAMVILLNVWISDAMRSHGPLIATESFCFSARAITSADHGHVAFEPAANIIGNSNMRLIFGSVQFFNLCKAVGIFSSGDVDYRRKLSRLSVSHHAPAQINVFRHDLETSQIETYFFSLDEPHGLVIQIDGPNRLECIMRVSTRIDAHWHTNPSHVQPGVPNRNHLKCVSDAADLHKPLVLRRNSLSRSFKDLDPHAMKHIFRNSLMGTVESFCIPLEVGRSNTAVLEDSGAMLDTLVLHKRYQALEGRISGTAAYVSGVCVNDVKFLDNLHHHVNVWMQNTRHARRRVHVKHLAVSASIKKLLDGVGGPSASQVRNGFFLPGPMTEWFLECSNIFLKPITPVPYLTPVAFDNYGSIVLLEDISPFDLHIMSNLCLKRHPVNSTFTSTPSGLPFEENAASTVASQNSETLIPFTRVPHTDSQTFPAFSQHPSRDNDYVATFETPIGQLADSIRGHCVGGIPLCPASVYLEQVLIGLKLSRQHLRIPNDNKVAVLRTVEFVRPLVYNELNPCIVITALSLQDNRQGTFFVTSEVDGSNRKPIHVRGEYRIDPISRTIRKFRRALPIIDRRISSIFKAKNGKTPQLFSSRTVYEVIFSRIVDYSKEYQTIQSLTVDPTGFEGYASVKLPALYERRSKFAVHPVFIDTLLHVAGFVANLQLGVNDAYICSRVDSINMIPAQIEDDASYGVYCSQWWLADQGIMLAEAYAVKLADPPILVARLKGIHFHKVRLNSLKRSLIHAVGGPKSHRHMRPMHPTAQPLPTLLPSTSVQVPPSVKATRDSQNTRLPTPALPPGCRSANDVFDARTCLVEEGSRELMSPAAGRDADARRIFAALLNICAEDIGEDDNLEKRGLCTSTSFEILTALSPKFGIEAPEQFLKDHPTLQKFQSYLAPHHPFQVSQSQAQLAFPQGTYLVPNDAPKPKVSVSSNTVARLNKVLKLDEIPLPLQRSTSSSLPLFLIHDGSGLISYYNGIPCLGRQVWGINNPHFISSEPWRSVVEMASYYASHIARVATGPIILGGWSFGGVVAYETSLQLAKKGVKTQGVLLIDSPNPINHVPLSEDLIDSIVNLDARSAKSDLGCLVKAQFTLNADMLSQYDPRETGGTCPPLVLLRSLEGFDPPGVSNIPQWLADRSNPKTATFGWESLANGPIKVLNIPGHHFTPFKPANIKRVSERIAEACALFEAEYHR